MRFRYTRNGNKQMVALVGTHHKNGKRLVVACIRDPDTKRVTMTGGIYTGDPCMEETCG